MFQDAFPFVLYPGHVARLVLAHEGEGAALVLAEVEIRGAVEGLLFGRNSRLAETRHGWGL